MMVFDLKFEIFKNYFDLYGKVGRSLSRQAYATPQWEKGSPHQATSPTGTLNSDLLRNNLLFAHISSGQQYRRLPHSIFLALRHQVVEVYVG
jgi:hypothetical protein